MISEHERPIAELFAAATDWRLNRGEGDWSAVAELHELGSREVLEQAIELTTAADPRARARGADILGRLGIPQRAFPEECLAAVIRLATHDTAPLVLRAAAIALGHLPYPASTAVLGRMADSEEPEIRRAVAFALGGRSDPEAVATLIHLACDPVGPVREGATLGLAELAALDIPEVRPALHQRLDDVDRDTRYAAIRGLARCGDLRAVPPLIDSLGELPGNFAPLPQAQVLLKMPHEYGSLTTADLIAGLRSLVASRDAA